jgi:hypothetical protein
MAVEDLIQFQYETDSLRAKMAKLPDIEKLLAKVFTYSIKHRVKAIYFEDVSLIKLKEFRTLLKTFRSVEDILGGLVSKTEKFNSQRLREILTLDSEGGMLPAGYLAEIDSFEKLIVWKKVPGTDAEIPEP